MRCIEISNVFGFYTDKIGSALNQESFLITIRGRLLPLEQLLEAGRKILFQLIIFIQCCLELFLFYGFQEIIDAVMFKCFLPVFVKCRTKYYRAINIYLFKYFERKPVT